MSKALLKSRVATVLSRMVEAAKRDEDDAAMFAEVFSATPAELIERSQDDDQLQALSELLEAGLGDLMGQDAFGSEGQCDPRGDGRNGSWSMDHVEGVDA